MNDFDNIVKRMSVTRLEPGDYTGEGGLLYCGKCHTPKQFRMDKPLLEGRPLPCPCQCEQERIIRHYKCGGAAYKIPNACIICIPDYLRYMGLNGY